MQQVVVLFLCPRLVVASPFRRLSLFFFFNDTATTEIYTLSLHDALPIFPSVILSPVAALERREALKVFLKCARGDRKSTRLNSSHLVISYAVFCLKKKSTRLNSSHLVISYAVFCFNKKNRHLNRAAGHTH